MISHMATVRTFVGNFTFIAVAIHAQLGQGRDCNQPIPVRPVDIKVYVDQSPHNYKEIAVLQPKSDDMWPYQGPGELEALVGILKAKAIRQCANGIILQGFPLEGEAPNKKAFLIFEERLRILITHD